MCVNLNSAPEKLSEYFAGQICLWIDRWMEGQMDTHTSLSRSSLH